MKKLLLFSLSVLLFSLLSAQPFASQKVDIDKFLQATVAVGLRVWAERDGRIVPLDPYEAYAKGAAKDIDLMQGCNKDEMGYFIYGFGLDYWNPWAADRKI